MLQRLLSAILGTPYAARAPQWPQVRAEHLERHPRCEVCGETKGVQVHHKLPVHLRSDRELDPANLITLCELNGCHFTYGHGRDWRAYNPSVEADCKRARDMIARRKYS